YSAAPAREGLFGRLRGKFGKSSCGAPACAAPCDTCAAPARANLLEKVKGRCGKGHPGPSTCGCCEPMAAPCCGQPGPQGAVPAVTNPGGTVPPETPPPTPDVAPVP